MNSVDNLINLALAEDIGSGDITTNALISERQKGEAYVMAKEDMILSGIGVFKKVLISAHSFYSDSLIPLKFRDRFKDGDLIKSGKKIIEVTGDMRTLLTGERTALNFLQRMSGIATLTKKFMDEVASALPRNDKVKIIDTRKTTPALRILEKYAVRCGGGLNHRFGLYDGILIKDNHIKAGGGIVKAVKKIREGAHHLMKIEVEAKSIKEVGDALKCKADVIMLDNMDIPAIKKAVKLIDKRALIEVSGGVNLSNVSEIAETGVDYISIGALTHSARGVDISMEIK
ncbi:MAG: nicotinate-nucleotide diphosphorylase (carboxylating) [Nitrospinae bacterium RIFCSPLOWO2_01_FULL_39_10]|nr:MAG: nicotinate-nucleotide diphosphorylase (carboxylating) [Nitrospinae bacterium RIFCSPLOWO2_01_FULL_39_10]